MGNREGDGYYYYYMNTVGTNLTVWKRRSIGDLGQAEKKVVWSPPASGPYSHDLWAPELHFLEGKWYIYFAADAGTNQSHRVWVAENPSADPLEGEWTMKGKLAPTSGPSIRQCLKTEAGCTPPGRAGKGT